ncbi:MAG: galactokinase [Ruminococcaceae bacterium]|nr:galactokinase [Oscillospiraceae bacterium]
MKIELMKEHIAQGNLNEKFAELYGKDQIEIQKARYIKALDGYIAEFGNSDNIQIYSVSGRSEISGNHTDHNNGKVIAAAINLDVIAIVTPRNDNIINIKSEGFPKDTVDVTSTKPSESRYFSSYALITGMCDGFESRGYKVGGFDAYTTSNVFKGSGLSSSAAFEVMVGNILNHIYNEGKVDNVEIAKIAQFAENVHFGKKSGLMDQMACAVGGFINIDFKDTANPVIKKIDFDLNKYGYYLYIVNTGGNHADLNDDYSSVPEEMKSVARFLGHEVLRDVKYSDIIENATALREKTGDRAILRAIHYLNENERVEKQVKALENGDIDAFFADVISSGMSSFRFLQNVYTVKNVAEQGLSLALAVSEQLLAGKKAAWRVHGGGFAGTIQAFVPECESENYKKEIEKVFGEGNCIALRVRNDGAIRVI